MTMLLVASFGLCRLLKEVLSESIPADLSMMLSFRVKEPSVFRKLLLRVHLLSIDIAEGIAVNFKELFKQ